MMREVNGMTYKLRIWYYTDYNTPKQWKPHIAEENNANIDTD